MSKHLSIPVIATLGFTMTGCDVEEKVEPDDSVDTDTETDTEEPEEESDISAIVGNWEISEITYSYEGETEIQTFPQQSSESATGYGVVYSQVGVARFILTIAQSGIVEFIQSASYSVEFSIAGETIMSYGYSGVYTAGGGTASGTPNEYTIVLDDNNGTLNCSLTESGDEMSCTTIGEEMPDSILLVPYDGDVSGGGESYSEVNMPETPEYADNGECYDFDLTTQTGDALEWGGFEDVGDDLVDGCPLAYDSDITTEEDIEEETEGDEDTDEDTFEDPDEEDQSYPELAYRWEVPTDGCYILTTFGTNFDHSLEVLDSCGGTSLGCSSGNNRSDVLIDGVAGQQVIAVITGDAYGGDAIFNFSVQPYDVLDTANESLGSQVGEVFSGDNSNWSLGNVVGCPEMGAATSFSWTAPSTGTATIDTFGSALDTVLSVKESGCTLESECNDDIDTDSSSMLSMPVTEGDTYIIYVGGYDGEIGDLVVNITVE